MLLELTQKECKTIIGRLNRKKFHVEILDGFGKGFFRDADNEDETDVLVIMEYRPYCDPHKNELNENYTFYQLDEINPSDHAEYLQIIPIQLNTPKEVQDFFNALSRAQKEHDEKQQS